MRAVTGAPLVVAALSLSLGVWTAAKAEACAELISAACGDRFSAGALAADQGDCGRQWAAYRACIARQAADAPPPPDPARESAAERAYNTVKDRGSAEALDLVAARYAGTFWGDLAAKDAAALRGAEAAGATKTPPNRDLKVLSRQRPTTKQLQQFIVSDDGELAFMRTSDPVYGVVDVKSGTVLSPLKRQENHSLYAAFSPSGRYFVTGFYAAPLRVWAAPEGRLLRTFPFHRAGGRGIYAVAFPRDDVAFVGWDSGVIQQVNPLTGDVVREFMGHRGILRALAMTPDGRRLVSKAEDDFKIWDVFTGREVFSGKPSGLAVANLPRTVGKIVISRDGRLVAVTANGWQIEVIELATKRRRFLFDGAGGSGGRGFDITPDGRFIVMVDSTKPLESDGLVVRSLETGEIVGRNDGPLAERLFDVKISRDGARCVAASEMGWVYVMDCSVLLR